MKSRQAHFRLGLFMLAGLAVLLVVVVALGAGAVFRTRVLIETYFDSSVQGLEIGSAVKYRGVNIGKVKDITFTYVRYEQDKPLSERKTYVLVIAEVEPALIGVEKSELRQEELQRQITRGLRVKNTLQGVTGIYLLELDFADPARNPVLPIPWVPENLYVPSTPGLVEQITNVTEALAKRFERLDFEALVNNINTLTTTADQMLKQVPVDRLGRDAALLLTELRATNQRMQRTLDTVQALVGDPALKTVPPHVTAAARDAAAAAERLRRLAESSDMQASLEQSGQLVQRLNRLMGSEQDNVAITLDNLRRAAENLRALSEELKRNPSQLLRSEPPPPIDRR
jgi:ABC-type transporter Mla subunit MlaD